MDATYIKNSIAQLKTDIFMHVRHRTLQKYTGDPVVNENQLFYLLLPLFNDEDWTEEYYEAAITASIVAAALYEHDEIKEQDATSQEQQLKVLAGDYYSGRYYEILAHSGNIPLIAKLSQAVVDRCEHQIKVYEPIERNFEEWLETLIVIESALIEQVLNNYHYERYIPFARKGLLFCRLQDELNFLAFGKETSLAKTLKYSVNKQYPDVTFKQFIQSQMHDIAIELEQLLQTASLTEEVKQAVRQYSFSSLEDVSQETRKV